MLSSLLLFWSFSSVTFFLRNLVLSCLLFDSRSFVFLLFHLSFICSILCVHLLSEFPLHVAGCLLYLFSFGFVASSVSASTLRVFWCGSVVHGLPRHTRKRIPTWLPIHGLLALGSALVIETRLRSALWFI